MPLAVLPASSGRLTVAIVSAVSGSLAFAAAVVVVACIFLALLGGPLVLLASLPVFSGGLTVAVESEVPGSLALAAAAVVGVCTLLALIGGPSAPLAAFLRLAAVWRPVRIMAALPRV